SASKKYPILNASVDDETDEIIYKHYYNIGIAADTDRGLLVPVVKDADRKSIFAISKESGELAEKARSGKLAPNAMKGASNTWTKPVAARGPRLTPLLNNHEASIRGIGRFAGKRVVCDGGVVLAPVRALLLSIDDRTMHGATVPFALRLIKRLIDD